MTRYATASQHQFMSRLEERMIRAAMPRTSDRDPRPLTANVPHIVLPLTYTLEEVVHVAR